MAKMGRPTKRTPETEKAILDRLSVGNTKRDAALAAGISTVTLGEWVAHFPDFASAVEKAQADARVRAVGQIAKAAQTTWQAAAWFLERTDPTNWSRRDNLELTGKNGGPVVSEVLVTQSMDDHERATLRSVIDAALAEAEVVE